MLFVTSHWCASHSWVTLLDEKYVLAPLSPISNAEKYGVDPSRIVVSGGSAGATNSVAAGVTFDDDYNRELTVEQDPTLATTHQDQNSSVQCVVAHWSTDLEAYLPQMVDPVRIGFA